MTDELRTVAALPADQLHAWFAETDAVTVTDLLRRTDDGELATLLDDPTFRDAAVVAILHRFPEFADAERLSEIKGTVRFDLLRGKSTGEQHTLEFGSGTVSVVAGDTADVTITSQLLDFARMVTGQCNAALLYLRGDLRVDGDAMLALAVGMVFSIPGDGSVAVDPTALDPVEVATAVAASSQAHMRDVMAGGFRPIVLEEVFRRFPEFIDTQKAGQMHLRIGFKVEGREDGGCDRYLVEVEDGRCQVEPDSEGSQRDATITVDGANFLKLATGQLNPVKGVLTGAMKVRGDRGKALALNGAMNPPKPRGR